MKEIWCVMQKLQNHIIIKIILQRSSEEVFYKERKSQSVRVWVSFPFSYFACCFVYLISFISYKEEKPSPRFGSSIWICILLSASVAGWALYVKILLHLLCIYIMEMEMWYVCLICLIWREMEWTGHGHCTCTGLIHSFSLLIITQFILVSFSHSHGHGEEIS